jgi:hypothetical protein
MAFRDRIKKSLRKTDNEDSANGEPTRIVEGSNANADRIQSCQNADVTNNEDWGLKVLLEPTNKDNIIEYFTHSLVSTNTKPLQYCCRSWYWSRPEGHMGV